MTPLAIAITTAPRRQPTLKRTLLSLREAGFNEEVHVFAEPGTIDRLDFERLDDSRQSVLHQNAFTRGCFDNWKWALEWLLIGTESPWLMILQDDVIWQPDAAEILRAKMMDRQDLKTGFLSPYTSRVVVEESFTDGWNASHAGWGFWGALAFCMPRIGAKELLKHPRFAWHAGTRQVDAVVAASMLELERPIFIHLPSLADHIGTTSTIGRGDGCDEDPTSGRRGYRFKAKG